MKTTKLMLFNNVNRINPISNCYSEVFDRVYTFQYNSFALDHEMKFVDYMRVVMGYIRHNVHWSAKVTHTVIVETALTIYKFIVLPTLDYGDYIWDRDIDGKIRKLLLIQHNSLQTVY